MNLFVPGAKVALWVVNTSYIEAAASKANGLITMPMILHGRKGP